MPEQLQVDMMAVRQLIFANPSFSDAEKQNAILKNYSDLYQLGTTENRGSIGMIKPAGWQTPQNKYDFVDSKYLYNRCHLIAFKLAGENDNEKNLITSTRYMNINGMLPYENKEANHVKDTNHHVLYRANTIYEGDNLLCEGVQLDSYCIEENGGTIDFNVFCYNVQPGVEIDYATGKNWASEENITTVVETLHVVTETGSYVLNTNSKKIHIPNCSSVAKMSKKNKKYSNESIETII